GGGEGGGEGGRSWWGRLGFLSRAGVVALSVSACVWIVLRLGSSTLERLPPAAQARVYMTSALAPGFAGAVFFGGATADWVRHGPMEICLQRARAGHSSDLLLALGLAFVGPVMIGRAGLRRGPRPGQAPGGAPRRCAPAAP